jgi:hypothetical protein
MVGDLVVNERDAFVMSLIHRPPRRTLRQPSNSGKVSMVLQDSSLSDVVVFPGAGDAEESQGTAGVMKSCARFETSCWCHIGGDGCWELPCMEVSPHCGSMES